MNNILIISEDYIKQYSDVMQNVDPKQLRMHIFESQDIYINYLLGTTLFDELFSQLGNYKTHIDGGGSDPIGTFVEARMLSLIEKLKPVVLYYTLFNASFSLYGRITNKGINTQSSENSESIGIAIVEKIKDDWQNKAEAYSKIVVNYIEDNSVMYPEFASCDTDYDGDCDSGHANVYTTSLYLGPEI